MFVEIPDGLNEGRPFLHPFRRVIEQRPVIGFRRDVPQIEEAFVERQNLAIAVDDEDAIERRFLLGAENRNGCFEGFRSAAHAAEPTRYGLPRFVHSGSMRHKEGKYFTLLWRIDDSPH